MTAAEANHNDGLQAHQRQAIRDVLSAYPQVESAILYGSRAMGRHRPGSDIDLTLIGAIDLATLNRITLALDDLLLPYTFDLSAWDDIDNRDLREHIQRVGVFFYTAGS